MHGPGGVCMVPGGCMVPRGHMDPGAWSRGGGGIPECTEAMTNRCKNITLPQISFAGGKYAL